jgi:uncharacterized OB-fold protein
VTRVPQAEGSPIPQPDEDSAPFWEGLAQGRLMLRQCQVCTALTHPAETSCHVCESPLLRWAEVPARGRLFSWAVERRSVIPGLTPPYIIAQLTPEGCDEGSVRLVGNLLTDAPESLVLGMPLMVRSGALPGSDVALVYFEPA